MMSQKFYLAYLTANENSFAEDLCNIYFMTRHHPGVDHVELIVTISEAKKNVAYDSFLSFLENALDDCDWISLRKTILKDNLGRDFSSAHTSLKEISKEANDSDLVLFRNRSAVGPFQKDWYKKYIDLFQKDSKIGLVGNTINLINHLNIKRKESSPHVQTYLYLSSFHHLKKLIDNFPGAKEKDRNLLILNGEIGLSKYFLEAGLYITSFHPIGVIIRKRNLILKDLPRKDMKQSVRGLPFAYRKSKEKWLIRKWLSLALKFRRRKNDNNPSFQLIQD